MSFRDKREMPMRSNGRVTGVVPWAASWPSNSRLNHRSEASVRAILPTIPILPDLLKLLDSASILS